MLLVMIIFLLFFFHLMNWNKLRTFLKNQQKCHILCIFLEINFFNSCEQLVFFFHLMNSTFAVTSSFFLLFFSYRKHRFPCDILLYYPYKILRYWYVCHKISMSFSIFFVPFIHIRYWVIPPNIYILSI